MFVDEAEIVVRGGEGGRGCASFRREKYVPRGGPDGGDGGKGGSVVARASTHVRTLLDISQRRMYAAESGGHGRSKNQRGRNGRDLTIDLPLGTIIRDRDTDLVLSDLTHAGQTVVLAKGGRGGRGNKAFATPTHRAPREFEQGREGKERRLFLELRLIADVGIIGLPNAGKSTLLSRLSKAHPKIAAYPFTTRQPHLGIVQAAEYREFVMADLPGLIEGAHTGIGLGDEFLRHIERTRVLVHMLDVAPPAPPRPHEAYEIIRHELAAYSDSLAQKPEIVVANKMDLTGAEENLGDLAHRLDRPVLAISAVTGVGLARLVEEVLRTLDEEQPQE